MCRVLLFGRLRDLAGWRERTLEPSPRTLAELRARLAHEDKVLGEALAEPSVRIAVDQHVIKDEAVAIGEASEVAFMPPMSGG